MDVFAHTVWTNAVFHLKYHNQRRLRYLAAFFGVFPDLVSFAPLFIYLFVSGRMFNNSELHNWFFGSSWTYRFAEESYNYTHSLVVFGFCFLLVLLVGNIYQYFKKNALYRHWLPWPMFGWALHIFIDIPSHPDYYHTPIFFPLSGWQFAHGLSWADSTYMVINYGLLIAAYIGLYLYQKKKHGNK